MLSRSCRKVLSLVTGNVTGGGGKATKQKPNGITHLRVQQTAKAFWMLTGDGLPAETLRNTKIGGSNVYMRESPNPLENISVFEKDNESVILSNRNDAFVL